MSAARPTAQETRQRQPKPAPRSIQLDCLQAVFRTRRPVTALAADQRFECVAVNMDRRLHQRLRNAAHRITTNALHRDMALLSAKPKSLSECKTGHEAEICRSGRRRLRGGRLRRSLRLGRGCRSRRGRLSSGARLCRFEVLPGCRKLGVQTIDLLLQ